jgi:hypothetical protein
MQTIQMHRTPPDLAQAQLLLDSSGNGVNEFRARPGAAPVESFSCSQRRNTNG